MTSLGVEVRVDATQVDHAVEKVVGTLSIEGMTAFMFSFVEPFLVGRARARFEGEGDDAVGGWAPLLPSTQAIRESLGYGPAHPINVRKGDLEAYITGGDSRLTTTGSATELTFPGNAATGPLLESLMGAQGMLAKQVARPVLGLSGTDAIAITTELSLMIGEALLQ